MKEPYSLGSVCVGGEGDPEMWKYFIAIEGPGGMWKDFISRHIEGLGRGDVERLCCHKWFSVSVVWRW